MMTPATIAGSMRYASGSASLRTSTTIFSSLGASVSVRTVDLCGRLTGNFPGRPFELDYMFTLATDQIISLRIQ
jgi:hypothetical protein